MADYILRPLEPAEETAFGTLFTDLGGPYGANFNLGYAAFNTEDTGTNKKFFHILNDTPDNPNNTNPRLISCLAVTDMTTSAVFGVFSIPNAAGDEIDHFELRDVSGTIINTSTTNNPLIPRDGPVTGENPGIISSPSISNLRHHGGGRFTGQFDVSVLIFFSWDVGDPFDIDLW